MLRMQREPYVRRVSERMPAPRRLGARSVVLVAPGDIKRMLSLDIHNGAATPPVVPDRLPNPFDPKQRSATAVKIFLVTC